MCDRCKELESELKEEKKHPRLTTRNWWVGVVVTITIFIITNIYTSGKVVGQLETHIESDPTYKELVDEFARKEDVNQRLEKLEKMIEYLYYKEGGRKVND